MKYKNTIDNYRKQIKHMRDYLREIENKSITPPHRKIATKNLKDPYLEGGAWNIEKQTIAE